MIILKPKNEEIIREALEYLIHKTGCSCEIADDQRIVPCENHEALAALDKLVAETRRETLENLKKELTTEFVSVDWDTFGETHSDVRDECIEFVLDVIDQNLLTPKTEEKSG